MGARPEDACAVVRSATWRTPGERGASDITVTPIRSAQTWPLCLWQLQYAGLGVVQLRFMRFHSHTSSQHVTISCSGSQSRVGKTDSAQWLIHLTGDSGNEISSRFTSVSRRECEVRARLLELLFNWSLFVFSLIVWCVIILQVEVDVHAQVDMELLPVRDLGVEISSGSPFFQEVTVVLGPFCFLWHINSCLHVFVGVHEINFCKTLRGF